MCIRDSDIAVDAADIALVDDEVKELPHLLALSKRMMTTITVSYTHLDVYKRQVWCGYVFK